VVLLGKGTLYRLSYYVLFNYLRVSLADDIIGSEFSRPPPVGVKGPPEIFLVPPIQKLQNPPMGGTILRIKYRKLTF